LLVCVLRDAALLLEGAENCAYGASLRHLRLLGVFGLSEPQVAQAGVVGGPRTAAVPVEFAVAFLDS
jgi:hypothetical protein